MHRAQQDAELLATPARDDVGAAERAPQAIGDLSQDRVADAMAVLVVDPLEVIHIDDGDRQGGVIAPGADAYVVGEVPAVEEPGEVVDGGEPLETADGLRALRLGDPLRRDVAGGAVQERAATGDRHARTVADPADDAVIAEQTVRLFDDLAVRRQQSRVRPRLPEAREVLRVHATGRGSALVGGVRAEQLGPARAVCVHHEGLIGQDLGAVQELADHLCGPREGEVCRLGILPCALQLRMQQLPLGHVLDDHDARVELGSDTDGDDRGEALAVPAQEGHVELALAAVRGRSPDRADVRVLLGGPVGERRACIDELVPAEPGHLAHRLVDRGDLAVRAQYHHAVTDRSQDRFGDQPLGSGARRRRAAIGARKCQ